MCGRREGPADGRADDPVRAGLADAPSSIGCFTAMTLQNVAYVCSLDRIEPVFTFAAGILIPVGG